MVISNGETSDLIFKTKMRSNQLVLVVLLSASVMLGGSSAKLLSSKASPKGLMPHVVRQLMLVYIYMLCRRTTVVCKRQPRGIVGGAHSNRGLRDADLYSLLIKRTIR